MGQYLEKLVTKRKDKQTIGLGDSYYKTIYENQKTKYKLIKLNTN